MTLFSSSYFALNKHIINTVTCFFLSFSELHPTSSCAGDGVFHLIGSVNGNSANLQTGLR